MFRKHYCDICGVSLATQKEQIFTEHSLVTIDFCGLCKKVLDENELIQIAHYIEIREKMLFLKNYPENEDF